MKAAKRLAKAAKAREHRLRSITLTRLSQVVHDTLTKVHAARVATEKARARRDARALAEALRKEGIKALPLGVRRQSGAADTCGEGHPGDFYADLGAVVPGLETCQGPLRPQACRAQNDFEQLRHAYEVGGSANAFKLAQDLDVQDATERFMRSLR